MSTRAPVSRLPAGIWALGFVSLLMDVSSEMIHSLLPLFMMGPLGMSVALVGLLEGLAEATALIVKVFSGVISDWVGRRKPLALLGYGLGAASKPLFALATGPGLIFGARLLDRVGKGIRDAPRDALVADIAAPEQRGAAFGLRQALDSVGAFLGPLLATALLLLWTDNFRAVFVVALVPGLLCVLVLALGVREPARPLGARRGNPISKASLRRLPSAYWWVVGLGMLVTLARFSEAFLVLRAEQTGVAVAWVPMVMVAMNVVYALAAYPFGRLADRVSRHALLAGGLMVLVLADLVLALGTHWGSVLAGVLLWGLHLAMTQGLLAAMVAEHAPADLRGTAFGFFNLVSGMAMLLASVLAGLLWQALGSAWTFGGGAGFCVLALAGLLWRPRTVRT